MTEKTPIGFRLKGAKAKYNEETQKYEISAESIESGASIERDKDGKPFFTNREDTVIFAAANMLYHAIIEPMFEDEEASGLEI